MTVDAPVTIDEDAIDIADEVLEPMRTGRPPAKGKSSGRGSWWTEWAQPGAPRASFNAKADEFAEDMSNTREGRKHRGMLLADK